MLAQGVWYTDCQTGRCLGGTWSQMEPLTKEGLREDHYHLEDKKDMMLQGDARSKTYLRNKHLPQNEQSNCCSTMMITFALDYGPVATRGSHWTITTQPHPSYRCVNSQVMHMINGLHIHFDIDLDLFSKASNINNNQDEYHFSPTNNRKLIPPHSKKKSQY